ncbi:MAG: hypothetical protein ACHQF2_07015 [Flavobacteriales bacterium]
MVPKPRLKNVVSTLALVAIYFFCAFKIQAQYFKVDTIQFESADHPIDGFSEDGNYFPEIISEKHWKVASYINEYLHMDFLHIMPHTKGNPFEAISPADGEMNGTTGIGFTMENNSSRIFSVSVSADYTSAYTENFTLFYNFNAQTGEYITLYDLFSKESMVRIQQTLVAQRVAEIKDFISSLDTNDETGYEQYQLYTACIPYMKESALEYESFFLTDTTITFVHGRCSNHAMRAIDDLDAYYNTFSFSSLKNEFSAFANELIYGKPSKAKSKPAYPAMKLMKGKIDKDLYVTFIMGRMFTDSPDVSGMYFYDKEGNMIELSATIDKQQWAVIEYSGPNIKNAGMKGEYKDGVFKGRWQHDTDGRNLPVLLKLAHQ